MNDFALKYLVKINYDDEDVATGVIIKLEEFPNNFFVFTAKHTFENDIEEKKLSIVYENESIAFKSYVALKSDVIIFVFDNTIDKIKALNKVAISSQIDKFGDCFFRGYPSSETEGNSLCEPCKYLQKVETEDNLFRISPYRNTDSLDTDGLTNAKGFSGSGLFIKNNKTLVGIIKEHEENMSAYNYIALAPLKEEISQKMSFLHDDISIPKNLIDEIKNDNVVLFVGNDFSTNFGFASNKEFIEQLLNDLDEKFSFIKMGIDSGGISNDMALNFLKSEKEIIKNKIVELYSGTPTNNHFVKTLWKFTSNIVTVNYDNLLESNIENIKVISTDNSYGIFPNPNFKKLFKLHGRVEDIDNILIFEDDYKSLYSKREIKKIQNSLKDKTCLFIGFSTDEVYFDLMYDALSCGKQSYIILTTKKDFNKDGFEPIFIESYHQLNKALHEALVEEQESVHHNDEALTPLVPVLGTTAKQDDTKIKVCIYFSSPLNSKMDYKVNDFMNILKKYSVEIFVKALNEDELLDSLDYDYNFLFTKINKNKIIIEDEYFIRKSIELSELEELVDSENTILFLDEEIQDSNFEIKKVEKISKIKKELNLFFRKINIKRGEAKRNLFNTKLPELIDDKKLNTFVGRKTDLQNIIRKILTIKDENRILTIKGSGGVGKTTIISKAVVEIADRGKFKEGIKFVQCEFINDYDDFENKITYAFDMNNAINFEKQLKEQELDENRLIILDNVETLLHIEDTQQIKDLIRTISDYATIVITSRELLNERDYEDIYELQKLTTDEAEELFLKLYKINKHDKKLLRVEILENLLDNNPLAIKLITKNLLKGKSLKMLKIELEESFFDITSEDIEEIFDKESDLNIERTKSLFQSINYSYQKLTDKEKLALETLSLFPDGLRIENLKNFYNQKIPNDKKNKKMIEHKINNFSDREIQSLEDKSLVINNRGMVMLQSIIGRFAEFRFNQRSNQEEFYRRAYAFNRFLILIIKNVIDNNLKRFQRINIFDNNKNNFIKSLEYISSMKIDDNKLIYIDRVIDTFAMDSSYNESVVKKLQNIKNSFIEDSIKKDFIESIDIGLKYYYGDFDTVYNKIKETFPINSIVKRNISDDIELRFYGNILNIYLMEGYAFEYVQTYLKNNLFLDISELFLIGEYFIAEKILDIVEEKDFFEFELLLALNQLNIDELKKYIKLFSIFKTRYIGKVQITYTLLKAERESIELKSIKKLIVVNPFTDGLKSLMFAMKDEDNNSKLLYEDAIKKLYHIKYYHVEAILIYSRYLKDREDIDYDKWFSDGKELAKKHHYRYLLHQFICLDSGVYTDYDENNYPLPEQLDYSGIIKKYGLKI